jgi:hypothetical protein
MAVQSVAINNTNTDLFVSSGNNAVTTIMICNKIPFDPLDPAADQTYLYLHIVANGDGVTDTNLVVNKLLVPAGETVTFDTEKIVLANGDRIVANTELPANLVATVSTLVL